MWRLLATGMCFFLISTFFFFLLAKFLDAISAMTTLHCHVSTSTLTSTSFTSTSMSQLSTTTGRHHDNDASTHHHKVRNRKLGSVCYIWIVLRTLVFCSCLLVPWPCLPSSTGTTMWELAFNNLKTLLMTVFFPQYIAGQLLKKNM